MTIRIGVAGGSETWRRGVMSILQDGAYEASPFETLGEWVPGSGGAAVFVPLGDESDLESLRSFVEEHPHIRVIGVASDLDAVTFSRGIRAGAFAVVDEDDSGEDMLFALTATLAGRCLVPRTFLESMAQLVPAEADIERWVTTEEAGWLIAMAEGSTVADLADQVGYSERAMFRNLKDVYRRLGVANRTEALLWASRHGLLAT